MRFKSMPPPGRIGIIAAGGQVALGRVRDGAKHGEGQMPGRGDARHGTGFKVDGIRPGAAVQGGFVVHGGGDFDAPP